MAIKTGKTLDYYGEMVGQQRGSLTDDQYRIMILVKIARNAASTDYNSIINILSMILECKTSDISLVNTNKPATVKIQRIPLIIPTDLRSISISMSRWRTS